MTPVRIAPWTFGSMVLVCTVCLTPLTLDQVFIRAAGEGTLLWLLLAAMFSLLGVHIGARLVDAPLTGWATRVSDALRYPRALFYILGAGFMLNGWLSVVTATSLSRTPRLAIAILSLTVVVYVLRLGLESTARFIGFLGLIVGFSIAVILTMNMFKVDFSYLLPHPLGTGAVPWLWPAIIFSPRGYDVIAPFASHTDPGWRRPAYLGVGIGALLDMVALILPVLMLGYPAASQDSATLLHALGTFSSTYLPFQRFGFAVLLTWQLNSAAVVSLYSIATLASLKVQLAPLTPWPAVGGVALSVLALSLSVMSPDMNAIVINVWSVFGLLLFVALPVLLLSMGKRTRRQPAPA
jgi:hypothetical protein